MTTPGVARLMREEEIYGELFRAVKSLPEEQQEDACKMIRCSRVIGNTIDNVFNGVMGLAVVPWLLLHFLVSPLLAAVVAICTVIAICFYAFRTRRRLVKEMNSMMEDPNYWKSIQATIEAAARRAGVNIIRK